MAQIIFLLFFWSLGYYGTIYFNEIKLVSVALMPYVCYLDPLYSAVSGVLLLCSLVVSRFKKRRKKVEPRNKEKEYIDADAREQIERESERIYGENGLINNYKKALDDYKKEIERMNENENKNESGDPLVFENGNKSGFNFSNSKLEVQAVWPIESKIDELLAIAKKEPVPVTLSNVPTWIDASKHSPTDDGVFMVVNDNNTIYTGLSFENGKWEKGYNVIGWLPRPVTGCVKDKIQVVNAVQEIPVLNWRPISEFNKGLVGEKDYFAFNCKNNGVHFGRFKDNTFWTCQHGVILLTNVTHFLKLPDAPQEKKPEITTIDLATLSQEKQDAIRNIMNT